MPAYTFYSIARPHLNKWYTMKKNDGTELSLYIPTSRHQRDKDLLRLHTGKEVKGEILALAELPPNSVGTYRLVPGKSFEAAPTVAMSSDYRWGMMVPAGPGGAMVWKTFVWQKNRDRFAPTGKKGLDLVDVEKCEGCAMLDYDRLLGSLQLEVSWGDDFDLMVLMTFMAKYEQDRRNSQRGSSIDPVIFGGAAACM
ncbi:hypothetical protein JDV02_000074 [Purpureocillium takamizusanense]|uniref:Uncharacterized protein n=1 Tax=Purpureocillium takamizusanense TaxID=2060973 RepID=A0A9Q8Q6M7_9HYPO|nr:uncharacterized protein JDV02_000074 [Purpureocillium takamizusanense]UNI13318.1 hypothetical protein JDV02_000074 [Purpureocillium takamizusanense]